MWLAGGLAVVAACVVVVAVAFLEDDRRTVTPVRRGHVSASELRRPRLPVAWRGYDRGHVDALLARAATTLEDVERYGQHPTSEGPISRTGVDVTPSPATPPSFLREELEDRGGDDAGRLDG